MHFLFPIGRLNKIPTSKQMHFFLSRDLGALGVCPPREPSSTLGEEAPLWSAPGKQGTLAALGSSTCSCWPWLCHSTNTRGCRMFPGSMCYENSVHWFQTFFAPNKHCLRSVTFRNCSHRASHVASQQETAFMSKITR